MENYAQFRQAATIISSLFSLATLIVYAILPELHNVHGLAIVCSMACNFIFVVLSEILGQTFHLIEPTSFLCIFIVFSTHYIWLCLSSWLGVLCFDIFWTFRFGTQEEQRAWIALIDEQESTCANNTSISLTTGEEDSSNSVSVSSTKRTYTGERRRFYKYSIFGWGMPLVLIVFAQILEHIETLPEWFIRPGFKETCWFTNLGAIFYVTVPYMVLYWISLTLALIAACYLRGKESTIRKNATPRVRAVILSTLTSIIPWVAEIPLWFSGDISTAMYRVVAELLVAVLVFVLYVFHRHILSLLYKRCLPFIRLWRRTVPTVFACHCCDKYGIIESDEA